MDNKTFLTLLFAYVMQYYDGKGHFCSMTKADKWHWLTLYLILE